MKFNKNIVLLTMTAMLFAAPSKAQEISTSLPLTSVGSHLLWEVGDQTLSLDVPVSGKVKFDLYSPRLDQSDYRSSTYYGDEQYDGNVSQVTTTFILVNQEGKEVLRQVFKPGKHAWETLFDQVLPAGKYKLKAITEGAGKNTFAVRLEGSSAALSADHLTVNVHSQKWVPVVNVTTDGKDYDLRMYDGDGDSELQARVRYPDGSYQMIPVSGERQWIDIPMPEVAGNYVIELRQVAGAYQYSNTVGFALRKMGTEVPLILTKVDETGMLEVTAELLLPTGNLPTDTTATINGESVDVDKQLSKKVMAGHYSVEPDPVDGATVAIDRTHLEVPKNGSAKAHIQIKPEVNLFLEVDKPQICSGDVINIRAGALSEYPKELPLEFSVHSDADLSGKAEFNGKFTNQKVLDLETKALKAGTYTVSVKSAMWNQEETATFEVLEDHTSMTVHREVPQLAVGETGTVTLHVTNNGTEAQDFELEETANGLTIIDGSNFSQTVQAGETVTISYQVRLDAEKAKISGHLSSGACAVKQTSETTVLTKPKTPKMVRSSTIHLPFEAPIEAKELVIVHEIPVGAEYVSGSAKLGNTKLPDPQKGASGKLYWTIPAQTSGEVVYELSHKDAIAPLDKASIFAKYKGERSEVLKGSFDENDYKSAQGLLAANKTENQGAVKFPIDGETYRGIDKVTIVAERPAGSDEPLLVNGEVVSTDRVGAVIPGSAAGMERLEYIAIPLKPGKNTIQQGKDTIAVNISGTTTKVVAEPIQTVADGSTPIRVKFKTLDKWGNTTAQNSLTLAPNLEPNLPDYNTSESGYQIRLENGEGILEIQPQTLPKLLEIKISTGDGKFETQKIQLTPENSQIGVGVATVVVGLQGKDNAFGFDKSRVKGAARGYYEGMAGDGKLYVAVDGNVRTNKNGKTVFKSGLLDNERDPLKRYPMAGDAAQNSAPLQSIDPVAALYDHPSFVAKYQNANPSIDVIPMGESFTAFDIKTKSNPVVSGFVAALSSDLIKTEVPIKNTNLRVFQIKDKAGSRVEDIVEGSDSLYAVTKDINTKAVLDRVPLQRYKDYLIDYNAGVVNLIKPLQNTNLSHEVTLELQVRKAKEGQNFYDSRNSVAGGVQVAMTGDNYSAGVAAVSMPYADARTNVVGARAQYTKDGILADAQLAYGMSSKSNGGIQASVNASAKVRENDKATVGASYVGKGYVGLGGTEGKQESSMKANAGYSATITDNIRANAKASYKVEDLSKPKKYKADIEATADYSMNEFSAGAGAKYQFGEKNGLSGIARVGYNKNPLGVNVQHSQSFAQDIDTNTTLSTSYKLNDNITFRAEDSFNWNKKTNSAVVGLDSNLGNGNYSVSYELPNSDGSGNRARFGASTNMPLAENMDMGIHANANFKLADDKESNMAAGTDFRYKADRYVATAGLDIERSKVANKDAEIALAVRGGVSGTITDELVLTADALAKFDFNNKDNNGQRFGVGYAYRGSTINSLGYVRYTGGTLAKKDNKKGRLDSAISAEYRQPAWAVRVGNEMVYDFGADSSNFYGLVHAGGTYYVNDYLGVGGWGGTYYIGKDISPAFGLEGSVRAMPGAWLTAGYNFRGIDGEFKNNYAYFNKGAYLRLDLTMDENTFDKKD